MKPATAASLVAVILLISISVYAAEPATDAMLSFQGFTGILNTPNAHVNREGSIHLMFSDQRENIWRSDRQTRQENYLLSVGLFEFFELGGRLTDAPGRENIRDLSASFKVTSEPLTRGRAYWPVIAAGIQDLGGGANKLQSRYGVISEDIWRFRLSAGYSFHSDRMKGGFGGVEFRAHDWVTLLGEYDSRDTNVGIRLVSPEIWHTPVQVAVSLKSALNHNPGTIDVAAGLTFPLDFRKRAVNRAETGASVPLDSKTVKKGDMPSAPAAATLPPRQSAVPLAPSDKDTTNAVTSGKLENLATLQNLLESAGFVNVRVGLHRTRELVVEYENTIFNHNELDALGVVAGIVSESAPESFETVRIVIKRKGIRMAVLSAPRAVLSAYMDQTGDLRAMKDSFSFTYDTSLSNDTYYLPQDHAFALPDTSLILAPGLQTYVGTEVGVFDYLLSFKPEIVSTLWKGGVFQARWDIPLAWSDNFDDGRAFRDSRKDPRMDRAMLFQGINPASGLMLNLGAGLVVNNTYGTLNEVAWSPGEGAHRLRGVQAWARDPDARRTSEVYLGSYRYLFSPLDLSLELTGGRYWGQDKGFSLEMKRFFGDTAVSTFYKNTTTAEGKHWQAAGIQFVFPLTPRKDMKIGPVQVRGADEWGYAQESTLAIGGQQTNNVISQALAINPQPTPAIYRSYYNRDRLNAAYVRQHLDRLREAWTMYKTTVFSLK